MQAAVRRTALIAILGSIAVVPAGCGGTSAPKSGSPAQTAGLFMTSLIREKATGEYDLAWKSLHPLHQQVAPRAKYLACENKTVFPGTLRKVSVVRVKDEPVLIAGQDHTVASKAVTIRVSVDSPGIPRPVVVTDTYHAIAVDGHWTWILTRKNFADYRAGHCPGLPPPVTKA
jgi:hypothetical protein